MSTSNITPEKFRACFNNAPNFDGMPDANAWLAKFRDLAPASQSRVLLNMLRDYNEFSAELARVIPDQAARARFIDALEIDARGDAE